MSSRESSIARSQSLLETVDHERKDMVAGKDQASES